MNIKFPLQISERGRTKLSNEKKHIRGLIEQVLFTMPGERINQPEFGSDLMKIVFAPSSDELASANQFLVQSALQRWLGDLIQVTSVEVKTEENSLHVDVKYTVLQTQEQELASFDHAA